MHLDVTSHASSHPSPSISISNRISSGIASVGWVSFNCTATLLGNSDHSHEPFSCFLSLNLEIMSCNWFQDDMISLWNFRGMTNYQLCMEKINKVKCNHYQAHQNVKIWCLNQWWIMEEKKRINQPEVMHCRGKIVASAVEVFHLLWHLQDIEQHKSANAQMHKFIQMLW